MQLLSCTHCGKVFKPRQNRIRKNHFCSKSCFLAHISVERETVTCVICGQEFVRRVTHGKQCCSRDCATQKGGLSQKGRIQTSPKFYAADRAVYGERQHPRTGKFETNCHALIWFLRSPEGEEVEARNLKLYMTIRYGAEEGERVAGLVRAAVKRFRKSGYASSCGWEILAEPRPPGKD